MSTSWNQRTQPTSTSWTDRTIPTSTSWGSRPVVSTNLYNLQDKDGNNIQDVNGNQIQVLGPSYAQDTTWTQRVTP